MNNKQRILTQFNPNMIKNHAEFVNKMDVIFERIEQHLIIIERSDRAMETQKLFKMLHNEFQVFTDPPSMVLRISMERMALYSIKLG